MFGFLYKRSFNSKIQLLGQKRWQRNYSEGTRFTKLFNVDEYIKKYVKKDTDKPYLSISSSLHGKIIPVVDLDSKEDMELAKTWLDEESIGYIIMESSPGKYWAFLDQVTDNNREAITSSRSVPGIDSQHRKWLKSERMIVVRGHHKKEYFVPVIKHINTDNEIITSFCDLLIDHFESEKIRWLYRYITYNNGGVPKIKPLKSFTLTSDQKRKLDLD